MTRKKAKNSLLEITTYCGYDALVEAVFFGSSRLFEYVGCGAPGSAKKVKNTLHSIISNYRSSLGVSSNTDLSTPAEKAALTSFILNRYGVGGGLPCMLHDIFSNDAILNGSMDRPLLQGDIKYIRTCEDEYARHDKAVVYSFQQDGNYYKGLLFIPYHSKYMAPVTKGILFCKEYYRGEEKFEISIEDERGLDHELRLTHLLVKQALDDYALSQELQHEEKMQHSVEQLEQTPDYLRHYMGGQDNHLYDNGFWDCYHEKY